MTTSASASATTHMKRLRKPMTVAELMTASCAFSEKTEAKFLMSSEPTLDGRGPSFLQMLMTASSCGEKMVGSGSGAMAAMFLARKTRSPLQIVPSAAPCAEQYPHPYAL